MVGVVEIGLASRSALTTISTSIGLAHPPGYLGHIPMSQNSTAAHLSPQQLSIGRILSRQTPLSGT